MRRETYSIGPDTFTSTWSYIDVTTDKGGTMHVLQQAVNPDGTSTWNDYYTGNEPGQEFCKGWLKETLSKDSAGVVIGKTTFDEYNTRGQVLRVTRYIKDGSGNWVAYTRSISAYNINGFLTDSQTEQADGTILSKTSYLPDERGNVTETTPYQKNAQGQWVSATTRTYHDRLGRVTRVETPVDDPEHPGQIIYNTTETIYNLDSQVWKTIDARGIVTENAYDAMGQLIRVHRAAGTADETVTRTSYTPDGKVETTTDALDNVTRSYYDTAGRLVQTVYPDGTSSETVYDEAGQAYLTTDRHVIGQAGNASRTIYDAGGRTTGTERLSGVRVEVALGTEPINGCTIAQTTLVQPGTVVSSTSTHYNDKGQVDWSIDAGGARTEYLYDDAGRQWKVIQKNVAVWNPLSDSQEVRDLISEYEYDSLGRQTAVIAPQAWAYDLASGQYTLVAAWTEYEYDEQGQVTKTTFHDGTYTQSTYDSLGRRTSERDPNGNVTDYQYNLGGQLTQVTLPAVWNEATGQTERPTYVYRYDRWGNLTEQQDAEGRITRFGYDQLNRRVTRTLPDAVNADGVSLPEATETTSYDRYGRVQSVSDFGGTVKWNVYDALGSLDRTFYFAAGVTPNDQGVGAGISFDYDYDELGRQRQVVHRQDFDQDGTIEADESRTTTNGYDEQGRLSRVQSPEGVVHYAYDPATGQQTSTWTGADDPAQATTRTDYTWDSLGRLETVTLKRIGGQSLNQQTTYWYTPLGAKARVQKANGVISTFAYDRLGRLVYLAHRNSSEVLAEFRYTLDDAGQRTLIEETGPAIPNGSRTASYEYDALNRLTKETITGGGTTEWFLDSVGNRIAETHTANGQTDTTRSFYNGRDQLLRQEVDLSSDSTVDSTTVFSYDPNGSTTEEKTLDAQGVTVSDKRYVWDAQNHLVGLDANADGDTAGVGDATFTYDNDGLRVGSRVVGGDATTDLLDKSNPTGYSQIIEERVTHADSSGDITSYLIGETVFGQARNAGSVQYLLADGHGSTRMVAHIDASNGELVVDQTLDYDGYGSAVGFSPATAQTYVQYVNQVFDPIMQQYVLRARYYDPATGRFWSFDPIDPEELDPASPAALHKYLYGNANPVMNWDPTGMSSSTEQVTVTGGQALLQRISLQATNFVARSVPRRLAAAFAAGSTAIGQAWNWLGQKVNDIATQVMGLFPQLENLGPVRVADRIIDFGLRVGDKVANLEVKYSIPSRAGDALNRLVGQMQAMVARVPLGEEAVVWTLKEPTLPEMVRLLQAAGFGTFSQVRFVHGVVGLYQWVKLYFSL